MYALTGIDLLALRS